MIIVRVMMPNTNITTINSITKAPKGLHGKQWYVALEHA